MLTISVGINLFVWRARHRYLNELYGAGARLLRKCRCALEAGAVGLVAQRSPSPWLSLSDAMGWDSAIAEGAGAGEIEDMLVVAPSAPPLSCLAHPSSFPSASDAWQRQSLPRAAVTDAFLLGRLPGTRISQSSSANSINSCTAGGGTLPPTRTKSRRKFWL